MKARRLLAGLYFLLSVTTYGQSPADLVRPFVGTQGEGNTYPGPSAPFGMIQLSPDTEKELWETASGYEYSDPTILGFSLTHLSGTGIPDLGDFLFVPQTGEPKLAPGTKSDPDAGYQSRYSHDEETASAGYYKVKLQKSNVTVELTAGDRAGMMRMTFPPSGEPSILTDLTHVLTGKKWKVAWSHLRVENNSTITGFHLVNGWAKERFLYFAARYSRPFDKAEIFSDGKPVLYNTYRFRGLPPGPIGNPGQSALEAAMHPANTEFFYFVSDGNGYHRFARNLDEHNRNVAAYRHALGMR